MGVERHSLTMKRFIVESLTIECHWIINDAWCLLIWSSTMINHNQPWKSAIISHDQPLNTIDISWFNTRLRWATKAWHRSRGSGEGVDTDCEPTTRQSRTGEGESSQDFFLSIISILNTIQCVFFRGISGLWTRIFPRMGKWNISAIPRCWWILPLALLQG
jgi:hypothetical protein